jgi:hypothetical protein
MGAAQSLFYSFFSVWRNWRAFLVYGAVLALVIGGFLLLAAIVFLGQLRTLSFITLLFVLFMLPTVFGSCYASYRDIFPDKPGPGEASLPTAGP